MIFLLTILGPFIDSQSALPVIEVVIFHANQTCLDNPALFKDVREMVAATTRCVQFGLSSGERETRIHPLIYSPIVSVKAMYWGPCVESPSTFIWLLRE